MYESEIEKEALDLLKDLGYEILFGPEIGPDGSFKEREEYDQVILKSRLLNSIKKINKNFPDSVYEEVIKKIIALPSPDTVTNNEQFYRYLFDGVGVEYRKKDGEIKYDIVKLIDFDNPENNDFIAVNQFKIIENKENRRPDIVIFINGLPLVLIELKNPDTPDADIQDAFNQIQTYKQVIPTIFQYNQILIISDGIEAKAGTITSDWERFMPWKTIDGNKIVSETEPQMRVIIEGMLNKKVLLDLIHYFIVFEKSRQQTLKKLAAYHQYYAVNKAIDTTLKAIKGDRRIGVLWHTQGSGKSLSMVFYTGKIVNILNNPTIVIITDRNDLDDQLYGTFANCKETLRQAPVQVVSRGDLRKKLQVASGGIIFTTIQKFFPDENEDRYPLLSERSNIIVIADEAHRSQYDFIDGFARHMRDALPNASFMGFTGTPIEKKDKNTKAVFGDYIDIYDIEQAVRDGATVKIYYESRIAKIKLKESEKPKIDTKFEEVTEGEEIEFKEKLKTKWARVEALVGAEERIKQVVSDFINHVEKRFETFEGKAMFVCMSRRICIDVYNEIVRQRPQWCNDDDEKGIVKVIMTGSAADPYEWQKHIRTKEKRRELANRFKDPKDNFKIAIVRDMWLTGFDVPCLTTMYIDKPMQGHGLMQAIARVNRVFKDKRGGVIVDYIGIADSLKEALADYTEGDKKNIRLDMQEAIYVFLKEFEIVENMFYGFDYKSKLNLKTTEEKLKAIIEGANFIIEKGKKDDFRTHTIRLSQAYALVPTCDEAVKATPAIAYFQQIKIRLDKIRDTTTKSRDEIDTAVKQIVSDAISAGRVIDIFDAIGIQKPDISIFSDEFLAEIRGMEYKSLAVEVLKKLLNDEIKSYKRKNLVKAKKFSEMLESAVIKLQKKAIETAEVVEELIKLAKEIKKASKRGEELGLNENEEAFYDAICTNESAVREMKDEVLKQIARELVKTVKENAKIDWNIRENVRAQMRVAVKRLLRKYNYPPDAQENATEIVLQQAALLGEALAGEYVICNM
ncbi:MAG: type I restriction endonuclease subunit R [Candidatus Goldbacteria bacterium]|nr:type I restriction endonuclease subunit R [Candidatus Goldiibacteriota bacterium]